jgi:hypothetical protein
MMKDLGSYQSLMMKDSDLRWARRRRPGGDLDSREVMKVGDLAVKKIGWIRILANFEG